MNENTEDINQNQNKVATNQIYNLKFKKILFFLLLASNFIYIYLLVILDIISNQETTPTQTYIFLNLTLTQVVFLIGLLFGVVDSILAFKIMLPKADKIYEEKGVYDSFIMYFTSFIHGSITFSVFGVIVGILSLFDYGSVTWEYPIPPLTAGIIISLYIYLFRLPKELIFFK
ncbi:MAG: hypothetical protein ACTSRZ_10640 [Promethearchaeota archaeon]